MADSPQTYFHVGHVICGFCRNKIKDPIVDFSCLENQSQKMLSSHLIGYKILLEILVKGIAISTVEVPYIFRNRAVGASKMSGKIIGQYLKHLWVLRQWQKKFSK
jgi:dolichol-phosphate mannosyltransferase